MSTRSLIVARMSRSMRFAKHLLIAALGATLDYLIGRLTNTLSWGFICWAVIVLFASAALDCLNEAPATTLACAQTGIPWGVIRARIARFRRPTAFKATFIGVLAAMVSCAFTLAVVTFRFCAAHGNSLLGADSPFNRQVIVFVSHFQASPTILWLFGSCAALAMFIPWRLVILPTGVAAIAIANAAFAGIPPLSRTSGTWYSQVTYSLGALDGWLFRLPPVVMPFACVIPALLGIGACAWISKLLR
jgi:hypothetical protein